MRLLTYLLLPALALVAAMPASAQTQDPMQIIAAFREATGGAAWDGMEGVQRTDTHSGNTVLTWVDLRRPALRTESQDSQDRHVEAYNGRDVWSRGGPVEGGVEVSRGLLDQYQAATDAFIAAQGYFFPDRFPFAARWVREERDGSAVLDVVELAPDRGFVRDYWFDRASGLLVRITVPDDPYATRIELGDYRPVGPVRVAHSRTVRSWRGGVLDRGRLQRLEFRPIPARMFEPGAAP
ncbi:MAG TPA: hypothetical protein VEC11_14920 [Allosphingosinicella sp.]|nr:hypothetical protein [Allosphingosinicella sp.]